MTMKKKTNRQNPTNKAGPAIIDRKADKRPDLGISVGSGNAGDRGQEENNVTGMIPETARVDPNNTDVVSSNEESGTADTVPGKRTAAASSGNE
jgi:hypothetical protein